jgi:hypothetical protein
MGVPTPTTGFGQESAGVSAGFVAMPSGSITPPPSLVDGRGAGFPATLGELADRFDPPEGFSELLEHLGAVPEDPAEIFLCIPEGDFVKAFGEITVDLSPLPPMRKARLIAALRGMFVACGRVAPAFGTVALAAPAEPPPSSSPAALATPPAASAAPEPVTATTNLAQTVDQALKGQVPRLGLDELRVCRLRYEAVTGGPPPERSLPTLDQLTALKAILGQGLPPYVDFGVWSTHGPRIAKFQRTEAAVLIGGAFVTRMLDAPGSFQAWEDSWALFATAMVSLGAARPGSLAAYLDGIKQLYRHFPSKWSGIVATDLIVRSERWGRLLEETGRGTPLDLDVAAPWDWVIGASAFGRSGPLADWWQHEVVLPMSLNAATEFSGLTPGSSSSAAPRGAAARSAPPRKKPRHTATSSPADVSREVCLLWNRGACDPNTCRAGRRHVCSACPPNPGARHRACDAHGDGGKGKGKQGRNRDKRDRKPDQDAHKAGDTKV